METRSADYHSEGKCTMDGLAGCAASSTRPQPVAFRSAFAFSADGARVVSAGFREPSVTVRDLR